MNESAKILYHYTSLEGFLGIIETKSIWATNILYLNDASEMNYSKDLIKKEIHQSGKSIRDKESIVCEFFETILEALDEIIFRDMANLFVCSFSEENDLLSQWRGYCPRGIRISIGFNFDSLKKCTQEHDLSIMQCNYEEKEQGNDVRIRIEETTLKLNNEIIPNQKGWDERSTELLTEISWELFKLAPMFKHPKFREEKEWRIIAGISDLIEVKYLIKHRPGPSMLIPYIEIPLPREGENLIIDQIVVGPTHEPILSKASIEMLMKSKNVKFDGVQYSTIPYRNW